MPRTIAERFTAELCEVCVLASAGYSAHELGLSEAVVERALSRLEIDGTATVDPDGDRFFSKLPCEGCGADSGTRETATITVFA